MKKIYFILFVGIIILSACSSDDSSSDMATSDSDAGSPVRNEMSFGDGYTEEESTVAYESTEESDEAADEAISETDVDQANTDRKVIYTADLYVETNDYQKTLSSIQIETTKLGGYVVESTMYNHSGEASNRSGNIVVRVPQEDFDAFIALVESASDKVIEQNISGQDVTEEFVDLESRLTSKRTVEERLLSFMETAEKTEDLLTISKDLSKVQEEIEVILGRMNYLQNKADYATVTISISEDNLTLSTISDDDLNTWEETQKQFKRSINSIIGAFSSIVIFVGGNLPVLAIIGVVLFVGYLIIRRQAKKRSQD